MRKTSLADILKDFANGREPREVLHDAAQRHKLSVMALTEITWYHIFEFVNHNSSRDVNIENLINYVAAGLKPTGSLTPQLHAFYEDLLQQYGIAIGLRRRAFHLVAWVKGALDGGSTAQARELRAQVEGLPLYTTQACRCCYPDLIENTFRDADFVLGMSRLCSPQSCARLIHIGVSGEVLPCSAGQ